MESQFEKDLAELINKYSKENDSDTPDFILARYLNAVLENFNAAILDREQWYGREKHVEDFQVEIPFPTEEQLPLFFDSDPIIDYDSTGNPPPNMLDTRRTGDAPDVFPSTTSES
jgi:hypothetical protein